VSPDCILKFACYLCLRDETVSPGFPTRTRLLIWSHSSLEECLFHLSAVNFPRRVYRFPFTGFHLAVLRTNLGPGANLALLRAHCAKATQLPVSVVKQNLLSAYHPSQASRHSQPARVEGTEVQSLSASIKSVVANLPDVNCTLTGTRAVSSRVSDFRS
jgi:hypothetical protein